MKTLEQIKAELAQEAAEELQYKYKELEFKAEKAIRAILKDNKGYADSEVPCFTTYEEMLFKVLEIPIKIERLELEYPIGIFNRKKTHIIYRHSLIEQPDSLSSVLEGRDPAS